MLGLGDAASRHAVGEEGVGPAIIRPSHEPQVEPERKGDQQSPAHDPRSPLLHAAPTPANSAAAGRSGTQKRSMRCVNAQYVTMR